MRLQIAETCLKELFVQSWTTRRALLYFNHLLHTHLFIAHLWGELCTNFVRFLGVICFVHGVIGLSLLGLYVTDAWLVVGCFVPAVMRCG